MADRVLRGSRLGAISYETEYAAEPAPRQLVKFRCERNHEFSVPFAHDAELLAAEAVTAEALVLPGAHLPEPEPKKVKAPRTHWDMLIERRTIADLEEVLAERLDVLRARRGGGPTKSSKTA